MKSLEEEIDSRGYSFCDMMERAGEECAKFIASENDPAPVAILAGKGRNGGDGVVIAKALFELGFRDIFLIMSGEFKDPLCLSKLENLKKYPVTIIDAKTSLDTAKVIISKSSIIIDAVFGIGFKGALRDVEKRLIEYSNENENAKKYAVDIPSGVSANLEGAPDVYFNTQKTLTMSAFKKAHVFKPYSDMCGETHVMDIGIKAEDIKKYSENYTALTEKEAKNLVIKRRFDDHKGVFGKVLTITGSKNMPGCVYLVNRAAVESGAGLVTAAFPEIIYDSVVSKLNECLFCPLPYNENGRAKLSDELKEKIKESDAIALGSGLGVDRDTGEILEYTVNNAHGKLIIDADGLNILSKNLEILKNSKAGIILTPHPGEMARLTKKSIEEIQNDRINIASDFSKNHEVTLILKGANTVIADKDGRISINTTGNPGLARGGSGDCLLGIIAGVSSSTRSNFDLGRAACYFHGRAADVMCKEHGALYSTPSRVAENISEFI